MTNATATSPLSLPAHEEGHDPIEDRLRANIRATIEAVFEEGLEGLPGRCRYRRESAGQKGYRNGHRERGIIGTFGSVVIQT